MVKGGITEQSTPFTTGTQTAQTSEAGPSRPQMKKWKPGSSLKGYVDHGMSDAATSNANTKLLQYILSKPGLSVRMESTQ